MRKRERENQAEQTIYWPDQISIFLRFDTLSMAIHRRLFHCIPNRCRIFNKKRKKTKLVKKKTIVPKGSNDFHCTMFHFMLYKEYTLDYEDGWIDLNLQPHR